MGQIRETYLEAAQTALTLLQHENTFARWNDESVLDGMTVGVLASHLAQSVLQVGWFLTGDVTGRREPVSVTIYYARLSDMSSRTSTLNSGVEQRSAETAAQGRQSIASDTSKALKELHKRLNTEPGDRRVAVAHRPGEELLLNEYLRTRLIELCIHAQDLALSIGVHCDAPARAVVAAVDLLVHGARLRHGDLAVLHALSRRERDDHEALRVI